MVWKKSKGDIIFWRDSNLTVCNPFLLPNKKAIQFFDVQRILQFSSWSTGYYQDYTARLLLSISDFRFCKKGKLYHPKGTFTNYIDQFWPILDYLPTHLLLVDSFEGIPDRWKSTYYWHFRRHLPTLSCQRSLWTHPNSNAY